MDPVTVGTAVGEANDSDPVVGNIAEVWGRTALATEPVGVEFGVTAPFVDCGVKAETPDILVAAVDCGAV